jgi:hypothetical protein
VRVWRRPARVNSDLWLDRGAAHWMVAVQLYRAEGASSTAFNVPS